MKKPAPLRWSLNQAGVEFGVDRHTVAARMQAAGITPGADGHYSTREVTAAIFGNLQGERLRKAKAEADLLELKVAEERKRSIPSELLVPALNQCFGAIAGVIKRARLTPAEHQEILAELRDVPQTLWSKGYLPPNAPPSDGAQTTCEDHSDIDSN